MAKVVHEDVECDPGEKINNIGSLEINEEDIAVWIDPIDSTAQYIDGEIGIPNSLGFVRSGLQCACVLIGLYSKQTGLPLAGIINQPFAFQDEKSGSWKSSSNWGLNIEGHSVYSTTDSSVHEAESKHILLTSESDMLETKDKFSQVYKIHHAAGAGYKLLCVLQGLADAYVLSKDSTFKWDTCAPHSLLLAQGGGIISYKSLCSIAENDFSTLKNLDDCQIVYGRGDNLDSHRAKDWCNTDGIVAYRSYESLKRLVCAIKGA